MIYENLNVNSEKGNKNRQRYVLASVWRMTEYDGTQPGREMERGHVIEVYKIISDLEKTDWDWLFTVFLNRASVQNMNLIA